MAKLFQPNFEMTEKQAEAWEVLTDSTHRNIGYGGGAGGGKILGFESNILTPTGWKKGKDLKIGDEICHPSGLTQRVIAMSEVKNLPKWRVRFTDGTYTDVAREHLWTARKARCRLNTAGKKLFGQDAAQVVETQELKKWLDNSRGNRGVPLIPVTKEVFFDQSNNPKRNIDPYLLGVILGDGHIGYDKPMHKIVTITMEKSDLEHFKSKFPYLEYSIREKTGHSNDIAVNFIGNTMSKLREQIKRLGLDGTHSWDKFIPKNYQLASIEERYELVRGLMDTDGYKRKDAYACYFTTVSKQLCDDMAFVLRSLGCVVTVTSRIGKYKKDGETRECRLAYTLYIKCRQPDLLFNMERKKAHFPDKEINKAVESIEILDENIVGRCITVSNPDGLYITDDLIVTHNSYIGVMRLWYMAWRYPGTRWFIGRRELSNLMKTTVNTYYKLGQDYGIPKEFMGHLDKKYNIIKFSNGSEILLLDCATQPADPLFTRFGSLELTGGFIDEANEIDEQAVTILKTRIARQKNREYGLIPKLLCTFNPDQGRVKRTFYTPRKSGTLPEDTIFIPSLATDNDYIDPEYITQLRNSTDEITKQRLLYGNFDWSGDAGKLFRHDEIEDLFETNVEKKDTTYISVDVARLGDDKTVICIWRGLECIKILHYDKNTIDDIANRIKDLEYSYGVSRHNIVVDSDGVGCITKGTEVFTVNGWKKVEDLELGDKLYSQDNEGNVVEAALHSIFAHPNTQVIELDNGYKFSRGHFMPVKTRQEYPYKLKSRDDIAGVYKSDKRRQYILKNDFKWTGKDFTFKSENTKRAMPNGGEMEINNGRTISGVHLARLLGWFVSEGYLDGRYFCLCQSVNSIYNDDIEKCIKNCGFIATKVQKDDEYFRKIGNKPLLEFVKKECYTCEEHIACNKKVPEFVKQGTPEIIKNFLETYNFGDGYIHKGTGMMYYATSSVQLREDLLELIYKKGGYGSYTLHAKAGSEFEIEGRTAKRTKDVRTVYEYKHNSICITPKIKEIYDDTVYDLRISGDTKLFMCRFSDHRAFWVHNGGLADLLRGCTNFVNNSRPYRFEPEKKGFILRNYANLKAQCYFKLKEMMEKRLIRIYADGVIRDKLSEELENIFISGIDTDGKVKIEDKKDLKRRINRSPDFADAIMFRMIFLVQETEADSEIITGTYEIDYDDLLY